MHAAFLCKVTGDAVGVELSEKCVSAVQLKSNGLVDTEYTPMTSVHVTVVSLNQSSSWLIYF